MSWHEHHDSRFLRWRAREPEVAAWAARRRMPVGALDDVGLLLDAEAPACHHWWIPDGPMLEPQEMYLAVVYWQCGHCAICGKPNNYQHAVRDFDPVTRYERGMLCPDCKADVDSGRDDRRLRLYRELPPAAILGVVSRRVELDERWQRLGVAEQDHRREQRLAAARAASMTDVRLTEMHERMARVGLPDANYDTHCGCGPSVTCATRCIESRKWRKAAVESGIVSSDEDIERLDETYRWASERAAQGRGRRDPLTPVVSPPLDSLSDVDALDGRLFEQFVAELLRRSGAEVVQAGGGANDRGADIVAVLPIYGRVVVQCKHRSTGRPVTPDEMYSLNGTARPEHGADTVMMVTNSTFTSKAMQFGIRHGIYPVDGYELGRWAFGGWPLRSVLAVIAEHPDWPKDDREEGADEPAPTLPA
ncbi:restriction endonuclease [Streptomyces sp. NPDC051563]|uniref:restriction endonuclease n=1 Tax=Streptomyces sp. NPDC051563 TaxID=3365659 RepID=UPI0037B29C9C